MTKMIPSGARNNLGGSYYDIFRIVGEIVADLGNDIESILNQDNVSSPSGFLRQAYSKSSSKSVYYAPRNANDGFPPRNNSLKDTGNFSIAVSGSVSSRGFRLHDEVSINQGNHTSLWGKNKGKSIYIWTLIDEGNTFQNRFTGNPRRINQNFTRDWHSQGYRDIFINKMGSQLKRKGWNVVK